MGVQNVALQLFLGGVWTSVPIRASPVTILRGHDPFGQWPRPTTINAEIINESQAYDPSRPTSLLYRAAGRNTRARIQPSGTTRVWGEVAEWKPEETIDFVPGVRGRASVMVTAAGLLRRLGTWSDLLRSPMWRTASERTTSVGHWPLEEGSGATSISNTLANRPSGTVRGAVSFGESDRPFGAASTAKVVSGSQLTGVFLPSASTSAGWQVFFSMRLPQLPPDATYRLFFRWTTSNGYTWFWDVNNGSYRINVRDDDGTLLFTTNVTFGAGAEPNKWVTFRCKASVSAGTVTIEPAWYAQGAPSVFGTSGTFAGSVGRLSQWWQEGNSITDGAWFSHIGGVTGVADNLTGGEAVRTFNGHLGESASSRYNRVMREAGLQKFTISGGYSTDAMGPQQPGTLLDVLKEVRSTDGGRIDDERLDIALTMTIRKALYNQAATLALTYPGHVYALRKEIADRGSANRVTVSNLTGGEFTAVRLSGPMSVQAPPAGIGDEPKLVEVNLANDALLPDLANWYLARGTLERPVYAEVTVDLVRNPGLVAAAIAVREGNMITLAGVEPDLVRLLVVGMREEQTSGTWRMTYQCEPYDVFWIGIWDDPSFRWDSRTSTLQAGYSAGATSMVITFTDRTDAWSVGTNPGGLYDLMIAGERVRVTTMGAVSGSGPWTQTATVVRAVNGVSKAQLAGSEVHVYDARRWGL